MSDIPPSTTPQVFKENSLSPMLTDPAWNAVPVPLTPFLGRDNEIDHICDLLRAEGTRLVTLTGPGGVGKTRLAIEAAIQMAPEFEHGACFVALASVRDRNLVPDALAQALKLEERGDHPTQDSLVSMLKERHLLLVLDNLEHVVTSVDSWLAGLFAECPRLRVLVTSRIAVQIDGEQRYIVSPLPLPKDETSEGLVDNVAVKLFVQRARAVHSDFVLTTADAGVVAEICHRLEGFPLAIELAASRVTVLSPPVILARLRDRLSILGWNRQDAPARHRTMRDAIAWSYDLLPPEEQALFRSLAVCVGGFTVDAAAALGGPMTLNSLTMLVDHSLVRRLPSTGDGERMAMYETIREFGLEQLIDCGEELAARDAHAGYFLQVRAEVKEGATSDGQSEWCARFEGEQDNLRVAIAWLVQQERLEDARKLATDTMWCHWIPRLDTENRDLLKIVLTHLQAAMHSGGRVILPGNIHIAAQVGVDPNRGELTAADASPLLANRPAAGWSAPGSLEGSAGSGAGHDPPLDHDPREPIGYTPPQALADVAQLSGMTDTPIGLTARELDVLRLMADGRTNQEIADALFLSLRTVTSHVTHVLGKMDVPSRTAAVSGAIRQGLI